MHVPPTAPFRAFSNPASKAGGEYEKLHDQDQLGKLKVMAFNANEKDISLQSTIRGMVFWTLYSLIVFTAGLLSATTILPSRFSSPLGTYANGFATENTVVPSSAIKIERYKFTGGVNFFPNGTETLRGHPKYVGEPSDEMDQAWRAIIGDHYFSLSEEEAKEMWGNDYYLYRDRAKGGYTGTLDMFHALHCLNQLRMALRRDHYPEERGRGMIHQLHCIDHLRQTVQCEGSTSIAPTKFQEGHGQYIDPAQVRTCRNFDMLQKFSESRFNGSLEKPRLKRN